MVRAGGGVEVRAADGTCGLRDEFAVAGVGVTILAVAFPARSEAVTLVGVLPE